MSTALRKMSPSLKYLEVVRQHLARFSSINPFESTLLVTGFPNVGKSSFVNNITNANLDV
jgi:nucleolar GTP-binding protein